MHQTKQQRLAAAGAAAKRNGAILSAASGCDRLVTILVMNESE